MLVMAGTIASVQASVTSLGSVSPVPPSGGGVFSGQLVVGDDQAPGSDLHAQVQINQGTALQYGTLIIGDEDSLFGDVNVVADFLNGLNSQFNLSGTGTNTTPTVQVGRDGFGNLDLSGGAAMTLSNTSGNFSVGVRETGVGAVSLSGAFTILTAATDFTVGQAGIGQVEISDGALVRTLSNSSSRRSSGYRYKRRGNSYGRRRRLSFCAPPAASWSAVPVRAL